MSNDYFAKTGNPQANSAGSSALIRAEIANVEAGFDKLPTLTANGGKIIAVNAGATALEALTTTGTGSAVRATSPTLVTPALGTPSALVGTNITGTAAGLTAGSVTTNANLTGHVTSVGNAAVLGSFTSAQLATALTDETGSGAAVFATSPTLVTPALGAATATSLTLTTDLAVADGGTGRSTGTTAYALVATGTTATGAQQTLAAGATTELLVGGGASALPVWTTATGSGAPVRATSPTLVTPVLGVATATSVQGIIGNVTPAAGTFTTLASTGNATLGDAEASDTHAIKGATTLLANSASAALTVTQTGSGNAFVVEDSASPDSTPFVIDASGRLITGGTASFSAFGLQGGIQNYNQDGHTTSGKFTADVGGSFTSLLKSRNTTVGGHTIVQSGDELGNLAFAGSDGTNFVRGAQIAAQVDGTPGTNDMPGRLVFSTTADGASTPTEAMRIDSTQSIFNNAAGSGANAYGFNVSSAKIGATANYGFYSNIAAAANRWNFYASGTADNYFAGSVGIGSTALSASGVNFRVEKNITGSTSSINTYLAGEVQSGVTGDAHNVYSSPSVANAVFTLPALYHFRAVQGTFGASATVTNQYGFNAASGLIGATNNYGFFAANTAAVTAGKTAYGFYSAVNTASGGGTAWGIYAAGTAANYFAGNTTCGAVLSAVGYLQSNSATATPAGGNNANPIVVAGTANFGIYFGSGAPTLSAAQGSLYLRSDGSSTSTRMYVNTNGSTGWAAVTTAS